MPKTSNLKLHQVPRADEVTNKLKKEFSFASRVFHGINGVLGQCSHNEILIFLSASSKILVGKTLEKSFLTDFFVALETLYGKVAINIRSKHSENVSNYCGEMVRKFSRLTCMKLLGFECLTFD